MLCDGRAAAQELTLVWLPQGNTSGANLPAFRITLPAESETNSGALTLSDLTDDLGLEGLGSLLVIGVDASGNVDAGAQIDGFGRIRSRAACGGGWVSQSLAAVPAAAFGTQRRGRIPGLRHEPSYRTNVGIVNLSASPRSFAVAARGEEESETFTVTLPAFSSVLTAIPNRNFGALTLTVTADEATGPWVSYGSSVDSASGDAWSAVARRLHTP